MQSTAKNTHPTALARSLTTAALVALAAACGSQGAEGSPARGGPDGQARESGTAPNGPASPVPTQGRAWVVFGADTVQAEVARTAEEREQGLMYRDELPDGTGMLFVFPEASVRSFWMQNTYVALDIAYMDAAFTVIDIQQMEPLTTDAHESAGPAMYALEVPEGWLAAHGVEVGDQAKVVFGG